MNAKMMTAACLAAVCGVAPGQAVPSPILTNNPGFLDVDMNTEYGDGWGVYGAAAVNFQFFGDGNEGHATLFGDMTANVGGVFQEGIAATPGTEYELTIRIQWEPNWDARTLFGLEFFADDDMTKLGEQIVEITNEPVDTGYRRYDMRATAPAGTAFVRPIVMFDNVLTAGASRACTVDNVLVREADDVLNLNPRFDDPIGDGLFPADFWQSYGAVNTSIEFFPNGNPGHATFFADAPGNEGGLFQLGIVAEPNESYTLSVDMAFEDNWDAVTSIGLEFYGADDGFLIGEVVEEITETPGAGYITYTLEAVAPASFTRFVRPIIRYADSVGTATELQSAVIDNLVVQRTSTVGPTPCNNADLAAPFNVLNFADVQTFLGSFGAGLPAADLAAPQGVFNFADVQTFLGLFGAGC